MCHCVEVTGGQVAKRVLAIGVGDRANHVRATIDGDRGSADRLAMVVDYPATDACRRCCGRNHSQDHIVVAPAALVGDLRAKSRRPEEVGNDCPFRQTVKGTDYRIKAVVSNDDKRIANHRYV